MIRIICLDIYGTVLATDDHDQTLPPRKGLGEFFDECDKRKIRIIATSDAYVPNVRNDISVCFDSHDWLGLSIDRFFDFYQLGEIGPKDYSVVARNLGISCSEILVIGDGPKDFFGARKHGCPLIICPEYAVDGEREWSFAKIPLEEINLRAERPERELDV